MSEFQGAGASSNGQRMTSSGALRCALVLEACIKPNPLRSYRERHSNSMLLNVYATFESYDMHLKRVSY